MIKYLKVSVSFEMTGELITRVIKKNTIHKCHVLVVKNEIIDGYCHMNFGFSKQFYKYFFFILLGQYGI